MDMILGLAVIYVLVHGVVIVIKKTQELTGYEKAVLIALGVVNILMLVATSMLGAQ